MKNNENIESTEEPAVNLPILSLNDLLIALELYVDYYNLASQVDTK